MSEIRLAIHIREVRIKKSPYEALKWLPPGNDQKWGKMTSRSKGIPKNLKGNNVLILDSLGTIFILIVF